MFNPFDLRGPDFLLFYACLGIGLVIAINYVQAQREEGPLRRVDTSNPYLIAYLRAGPNEAARVAAVSLIDRGLIKETGTDMLAAVGEGTLVRRPLEKAVIGVFARSQPVDAIFTAPAVQTACREFDETLSSLGLLPDDEVRAQRRSLLKVALAVLLGVAGLKIFIAFGRGHTNVLFLIVLALVFSIVAWRRVRRWRTRRGDKVLKGLQGLFSRLRTRSARLSPGGASADAALLAAVFGVGALPPADFGYAHRLFRKSSSGSSDSGSSSSGGSSCGGGGGGGSGCGGCGGGGD